MNPMILFKGATLAPAVTLAVIAFVLGAVAVCAICKIACPCGKKSCAPKGGAQEAKKPARKAEEKPFEKRKPHPAPADGSTEIYVGNLSYEMTEDQLRKEFEAYGTVSSVRLVMNRASGRSRGYGFVQMPNRDEVDKAIAALNDKEIQGRCMRCNVAKNTI